MAMGRVFRISSVLFAVALVLLIVASMVSTTRPVKAETTELYYDDGVPLSNAHYGCPVCSTFQGVRFSLPAGVPSAALISVRFYLGSSGAAGSYVYVTESDHQTSITASVLDTTAGGGWHTVTLTGVTVSGDFWVVIKRPTQDVNIYYDGGNDAHRSFNGDSLADLMTYSMDGDLMLRATIRPEIHVGSDQPFKTIQAGVDAASPGVPIIVHDGTYVENVKVDKSLTISSLNGSAKTIVRGANINDNVFTVTADGVSITGFTIENASATDKAGIYIGNANQCAVTNNSITGNNIGIYLAGSSSSGTICNNEIYGNSIAVRIEASKNQITGNYIHGNTASAGSAIYLAASASDNPIHFNKIVNNSNASQGSTAVFNENSAEAVNASLNWWGNTSGPYYSTNPSGTGDAVSDGVKFTPWLSVEPVAAKSGIATGDPFTLDATAEASTTVIKTGSGTPTIWVASYADNPGGTFPKSSIGKYIDVYFDSTTNVTQTEIRLYYTAEQTAGLNEGSLRLYWWDSSNSKWEVCKESGVNKVERYVWAKITAATTPSLGDLTGTPFTAGTTSGGFPWLIIVGIAIVLVLVIVIGRIAVRLMAKRTAYE